MANSIVIFRDRSFHELDILLEMMVMLFVRELEKDPDANALLSEMVSEWLKQREWAFGAGVVSLKLDKYLGASPEALNATIRILSRLREELTAVEELSDEETTQLLDATPEVFVSSGEPQPTAPILRAVDKTLGLLDGSGGEDEGVKE